MWMKGIRNCMALHVIVCYQDLAAYPILASSLLLFALPLTSMWSSIFTCPSPVKVGVASWPIPKEKSWVVSIRKGKTREAQPHLHPNSIYPIPRFILWASGLFPVPTVSSLFVDQLLIPAAYSTEPSSMPDTFSYTCNTKQYFCQSAWFLTKKIKKNLSSSPVLAAVGAWRSQQNQHSGHWLDKPEAAKQDNPSTSLQQHSHHLFVFICVRNTSDPPTHSK